MENNEMLRKLAEEKLHAFATGNMGKRIPSKRKLKEQRQREEEEAIGHAFQEFYSTFQEVPSSSDNKVWIKGGTYNPDAQREDVRDKGYIYKPTAKTGTSAHIDNPARGNVDRIRECVTLVNPDNSMEFGKRGESKKSNLELLKEEMKLIQKQRELKYKMKETVTSISDNDFEQLLRNQNEPIDMYDPNTTNLYVVNLSPAVNENKLMEIFGKHGPLASVKIMKPRTDKDRLLGYISAFIAFMNRKDGERALRNLNGKEIMGFELKINWSRGVPLPDFPVYIPPALRELSQPPPFSGLPFNAQPLQENACNVSHNYSANEFNELIKNSVVRVVVPNDRKVLGIIHRMIEFVLREGPLFEAMIMKNEIANPMYSFLFDNCSHQHIYYRWKLFSICQGDSLKEWRTAEFRMFANGSIWKPPPMNPYTEGMPEHLIEEEYKDPDQSLSSAQRNRFEEILEYLSPDRLKVGEAMVFAMQHGKACDEICNMILSIIKKSTDLKLTMACLYLVSDILHNSQPKICNTSQYRHAIESRVAEMLNHTCNLLKAQEVPEVALGLRTRITAVLNAWRKMSIYSMEFINRLESIFQDAIPPDSSDKVSLDNVSDNDSDGVPLGDDDIENYENYEIDNSLIDFEDILSSPSPPHRTEGVDNNNAIYIHIPSKWD